MSCLGMTHQTGVCAGPRSNGHFSMVGSSRLDPYHGRLVDFGADLDDPYRGRARFRRTRHCPPGPATSRFEQSCETPSHCEDFVSTGRSACIGGCLSGANDRSHVGVGILGLVVGSPNDYSLACPLRPGAWWISLGPHDQATGALALVPGELKRSAQRI